MQSSLSPDNPVGFNEVDTKIGNDRETTLQKDLRHFTKASFREHKGEICPVSMKTVQVNNACLQYNQFFEGICGTVLKELKASWVIVELIIAIRAKRGLEGFI